MSAERERLESPTDALIAAMEQAEDLECVLIVGFTKAGQFFMCAHSADALSKLGLLAMANHYITRSALSSDDS